MLQTIGPGAVFSAIIDSRFTNVQADFDVARFLQVDSNGGLNRLTVTFERVMHAPPPGPKPDPVNPYYQLFDRLPPVLAGVGQRLIQAGCTVELHEPGSRSDNALATLSRTDYLQVMNRLEVTRVNVLMYWEDGRAHGGVPVHAQPLANCYDR